MEKIGSSCFLFNGERIQRAAWSLKLVFIIVFLGCLQVPAHGKRRNVFIPRSLLAENRKTAPDQQHQVSGTITDATTGAPLVGVTIKVKGSALGTVTGADGRFTLEVPDHATLVISYVGYVTRVVTVGSKTEIGITLEASATGLNQVVVVGYGTQKKVDLTGSVATVSAEELENRPVTNVSSALTGLVPGAYIRQSKGDPRSDGASISIRGIGTLNNSAPLVLIDGIPGDIDDLNPGDIANISVLKDAASAAIYGAQAANGVILVTTKDGEKGAAKLSYHGYFSQARPMNVPEYVTNSARNMSLTNEGFRNSQLALPFAQQTIDEWEQASRDPNGTNNLGVPNWLAYPNTNWEDYIFEHNVVQKHNLAVSGGSEHMLYRLSGQYLNDPGTMPNTALEEYQIRINVKTDIGKHITVGTQTFASTANLDLGDATTAFAYLRSTAPYLVPVYDGKYGGPQAAGANPQTNNLLAVLNQDQGKDRRTNINTTWYSDIHIIKGLSLDSKFNYQTGSEEVHLLNNIGARGRWNFAKKEALSVPGPPSGLSTAFTYNKNYAITFNHVLHYDVDLAGIHHISALAGYEEYYFNTGDVSAGKKGLIDPSITTLSSATQMQSIEGDESDHARRSWFGRVNYAYKQKYLLEGNIRYDGSSRFSSQDRWGVFPSVSAGWRISEEEFFKRLNLDVQNLKLRASWGQLGNNQIGDYEYQRSYGTVNYSFGGTAVTGLASVKMANPALQWESTTITDLGLDASLLQNRMDVTLDYYNKLTNGILTKPLIPLVLGTASPPTRNTASVLNRGFEVVLNWHDEIGRFRFSVTGNFAYNFNDVTNYQGRLKRGFVTDSSGKREYVSNLGSVSDGDMNRILEGHPINEYFLQTPYHGNGTYKNPDGSINPKGGPRDGMIRTPEDLAWVQAMADAGYIFMPIGTVSPAQLYYGDLIYADNNGDGIYGNTYDRQFTGTSATPKYNFGLRATASWNGFDFSMLWAGSAGRQLYWLTRGAGNHSVRVRNGYRLLKMIADDHYFYDETDPDDPANNIHAKYPRLKEIGSSDQNSYPSTFWLYDASYIKLKNIQIGYTFPKRWVQHAWMSSARVFISASNLLLITKYPGMDPEITGTNAGAQIFENYPTMTQMTLGVGLTF